MKTPTNEEILSPEALEAAQNDSDLDAAKVAEKLRGGVRVEWDSFVMIVEPHMIEQARSNWKAAQELLTSIELAETRASVAASIERLVKKMNRNRIKKEEADALMSDLCLWHVMGAN